MSARFWRELGLTLAWGLIVVLLAALLGGCAGTLDRATQVQTQAAAAAELTLCRAISIGEWRRRYGGHPSKAAAWAILCADGPLLPPTPPEVPGSGQEQPEDGTAAQGEGRTM